ncbi:MAG: hypothetical protein IRZ16_18770, partial [Myxococcaceae bacterium]|nr:hypothetical protein [Myxococcaceae bacterium]
TTEKLPAPPERILPRRTSEPSPPAGPPKEEIPPGPAANGSASSAVFQPTRPHPFLYPTSGGLGAGITLNF